jgi:hypothetical protein
MINLGRVEATGKKYYYYARVFEPIGFAIQGHLDIYPV